MIKDGEPGNNSNNINF